MLLKKPLVIIGQSWFRLLEVFGDARLAKAVPGIDIVIGAPCAMMLARGTLIVGKVKPQEKYRGRAGCADGRRAG
jgi:hypothetical protein